MCDYTIEDIDQGWLKIQPEYPNTGDTPNVKQFVERNEKPLAELREKMAQEVAIVKEDLHEHFSHGVAIGISPTDNILQKFNRREITHIIEQIFKRLVATLVRRRHIEIKSFDIVLIGEYSPQYRWHYHGVIVVDNVLYLDKVRRMMTKHIGRTVVQQINNTVNYFDYMFKQYECPVHGLFYPWHKDECIARYDYLPHQVKQKFVEGNTGIKIKKF